METLTQSSGFRQELDPLEFAVFGFYHSMSLSHMGINLMISGGKDSMVLATLHKQLQLSARVTRTLKINLHAVHFNHKKRLYEADLDEDFVRSWCQINQIPLRVFRWGEDVPGPIEAQLAKEKNFQNRARVWRKLQAEDVRRELQDATGVCYFNCTAHHLDDNSESVLEHLIRGSGLFGLLPMPLKQHNTVHPLAHTPQAKLRDYGLRRGVSFREDSSNLDCAYTRNKIRAQVIPALRSLNPKVDEALLETGLAAKEFLDEVHTYYEVDIKLGRIKRKDLPCPSVFLMIARNLHPELSQVLGKNVTRHILHTIALWRGQGKCSAAHQSLPLAKGWSVCFSQDEIWFERPPWVTESGG